jgi:hypothetical protein
MSDKPAPAPSFPLSSQVSMLVLSDGRVSDRVLINQFVSTLHSLKGKWGRTWHTYPTPQTTVLLTSATSKETLCKIDIGPNWVGASCPAKGWPPTTHLTEDQAAMFGLLVKQLEGKAEPPSLSAVLD